ncbi:putative ribonuclease H-like domain-containing protein [Tanacetum coccineum]
MSHPSPKRNMFPKAVLMRSGLVSLTTTTLVNTVQPRSTMVNTVSGKNVNTARPKAVVNAARPKAVLSDVKGNQVNVVKASACWVWKPKTKVLDHVSKHNNASTILKDDYSRFSWVFFLATKDETSGILKSFITGVENLIDQRVKVIRCDNETEFKNKEMNQFCERKGIKREFSVARTPQQNRVAKRKNRTLIEAARTMLADSKLPTTFWAEAVNTACYVQNRVLVTKPHNKTPYELFLGRKPALGFMRPFGCLVTILNTIDHLGKFDGKADEGFFVGYLINRSGPDWLFDIDTLTMSMNYKPVVTGNQSNGNAGTKASDDAGKARMETVPGKDYILLPLWTADPQNSQSSKSSLDAGFKPSGDNEKKVTEEPEKEGGDPSNEGDSSNDKEKNDSVNCTNNINTTSDGNNTNNVNTVSSTVNTAGIKVNAVSSNTSIELPNDPNIPEWEDIVYSDDYEDVGAEADMNNLDTFIIEAIRLFLAYASFKDFVVYQMDVKSAFIYGKIEEEVYVCQPPGFEDPDFRDRSYTIKQKEDGIFISQDKYVTEILKKFGFTDVKTASIPMETQKLLLKDEDGKEVDVHLYRSMIGSLMYLTSSRPDIMFVVCACARYQVNPKVSHLHAVKRILKYSKGQPKLGIWYPKDSPFDLVAYTNSDYAGASLDRKFTTGGCQFLGSRLISWQCKKQTMVANSTIEAEYVAASSCYGQNGIGVNAGDSKLMLLGINLQLRGKVNAARHKLTVVGEMKTVNGEQLLQALVDGKKIIITEATVRRDLQLEDADGIDCLPNATIFEQLTLMRKQKSRRPKDKDTQVPQSSVPSDPTNVADEAVTEAPSVKLKELMDFCTKQQQRVLDLENTKTAQGQEITSLKKRVKKLEKKGGSRTHKLKRLYKGRKIDDIDKDAEITLVNETQGRYRDKDMFEVNNLDGDEVVVKSEVTDKADEKRNIVEEAVVVTDVVTIPVSVATITNVELTLAQTLAELKSARPKTKGVVMQEPSESTPTISLQLPSQVKGQGSKDKEKFDEEDRLAREKAQQVEEANIAWDDIQAKIDADYQLAERLQAQEQQELTIKGKSTLFV